MAALFRLGALGMTLGCDVMTLGCDVTTLGCDVTTPELSSEDKELPQFSGTVSLWGQGARNDV